MLIWTFSLVLICGTLAQNLSALFCYILFTISEFRRLQGHYEATKICFQRAFRYTHAGGTSNVLIQDFPSVSYDVI
jgi:hypothetical protein